MTASAALSGKDIHKKFCGATVRKATAVYDLTTCGTVVGNHMALYQNN